MEKLPLLERLLGVRLRALWGAGDLGDRLFGGGDLDLLILCGDRRPKDRDLDLE